MDHHKSEAHPASDGGLMGSVRTGTMSQTAYTVRRDDMRDHPTQLDAEREQGLDAALERMRAAFADVSEEQIERDVAEVIEGIRGVWPTVACRDPTRARRRGGRASRR